MKNPQTLDWTLTLKFKYTICITQNPKLNIFNFLSLNKTITKVSNHMQTRPIPIILKGFLKTT